MFDIRKIQEQVIFNAVMTESDAGTAATVVYGSQRGNAPEDNPTWVNAAMGRLENHFAPSTVKQIRMNCQCGYGMDEKLALVEELMEGATSLETFAGQDKAKEAGLSCANGTLYLEFAFCPCPMLAEVEKLDSHTWCQCTAGYSKALFEKVFGCHVDVELLQSIKAGDEKCRMSILPQIDPWG